MSDPTPTGPYRPPDESLEQARLRDRVCDLFEGHLRSGENPRIEDYVDRPDVADRIALLQELLKVEVTHRRRAGEQPVLDEYRRRFPDLSHWIDTRLGDLLAPASPAPSGGRFAPGQVLGAGRYRVIALLGKGGMGEVYRADDLKLSQPVALKFLPERYTTDPAWVERLRQEVALARQVAHRNVCRVYDIAEHDGQPFLTMEFIDGEDLDALLRKVGYFTQDKVVEMAGQLCDGLAAIHDKKLLHRDLKPSNLLLDREGQLRLVDFGLAALAERIGGSRAREGTALYMAPEQLDGREATARSDLFAVGLILYELTTGQRAFPVASASELSRRYTQGPPHRPSSLVPKLDPALDRVILRCLLFNPSERLATARDVQKALPPLSRKLTADLPIEGKLRPRTAWLLLAAVFALLWLNSALTGPSMLYRQVPLDKSPDGLRDAASEIAALAGFPTRRQAEESGQPWDSGSGMEWDETLLAHLRGRVGPENRWAGLRDGRPAPLYFWFRQAPRALVPYERLTPADPPPTAPGMVCVFLSPTGELLEFHAIPDANTRIAECGPDWSAWFKKAGLDLSAFNKAEPSRVPPVFADSRMAWVKPGANGEPPMRVEAASQGGTPVCFQVVEPLPGDWDRPDRLNRAPSSGTGRATPLPLAGLLVQFIVLALGAAVAWRNWQLDRVDRRGAFRLVALYLGLSLLYWLFTTPHTDALAGEHGMLTDWLGQAAFWATVLTIAYLSLEPYMRRHWPARITAWNRLFDGRFRDPLVGRDILIGTAIGLAMGVMVRLYPLSLTALGNPSFVGSHPMVNPPTPQPVVPFGWTFHVMAGSLMRSFFWFTVLLLVQMVVRRELISFIAVSLILGSLWSPSMADLSWMGVSYWFVWMALGTIMYYFAAMRFGLLAFTTAVLVLTLAWTMPLTLDFATWYYDRTLTACFILAGLGVYGFFVSLGDQSAIPRDL